MLEPSSFSQKLFRSILPRSLFEDMRSESMAWTMQCSNCKHEASIWSLGGIRWKAAGNPRTSKLCRNCGQLNWHVIYKKENGSQ
jgi:hypothetical protein